MKTNRKKTLEKTQNVVRSDQTEIRKLEKIDVTTLSNMEVDVIRKFRKFGKMCKKKHIVRESEFFLDKSGNIFTQFGMTRIYVSSLNRNFLIPLSYELLSLPSHW